MRQIINFDKLFQSPDCILNRSFRHQLLAAIITNIITFSHGIGLGWLSPTLTKIQSTESPLDFDIATSEASWIGSLIGLGSFFGCLLFGNLLNRVGRKVCIYMIAVPHICLWTLIYFAPSVEYLFIARFLGGTTGGASYVVLPIFISEIADTSIRGTLSAFLMLSINFGVLIGYIISTHLSYYTIPFLVLVLPLGYLLAVIYFPETPQHLLRKGKYFAAEKSFKFYKNCTYNASYSELQKCNQEFEDLKILITKGKDESSVTYKDFVTKPALKAFLTAAVLLIVNQFCGMFAFVNYMSRVFAESGSPLDPNTCTILMGAVQIFGAYAASLFVDRCGRRILMLLSTGGVGAILGLFGIYTFYARRQDLSEYNWLPLLLMTLIVFLANIGIVAVTFVLLVELYPAKIRSICASASMAILSLFVFTILKIFPIYLDTYGISVTMWSCSGVSIVCFLYLTIYLPETKGKSMDAD